MIEELANKSTISGVALAVTTVENNNRVILE